MTVIIDRFQHIANHTESAHSTKVKNCPNTPRFMVHTYIPSQLRLKCMTYVYNIKQFQLLVDGDMKNQLGSGTFSCRQKLLFPPDVLKIIISLAKYDFDVILHSSTH